MVVFRVDKGNKLAVFQLGEAAPAQAAGGVPEAYLDAEELMERYLAGADIAASTRETYRRALRQFARWSEGKSLRELTRADILEFKRDQLESVRANTAGAYLSAVKGFFRWLESERIFPNVAAGVKGAKLPRGHRKDALTPTQVGYILEVLKKRGDGERERRDFAIFNLLVRTGLRTIELERADIGDIRAQGAQAVLYVQGKGRAEKDEFVVLTDAAVRPIYAYLALRSEKDRGKPLFASLSNKTMGQRLKTRSLREIVKGALREAGFDDSRLTAHSLRHTAVTLSLLGGASLQQAQAMARHTSINTTLVYSHNIDRVNNAGEFSIDKMLGDA